MKVIIIEGTEEEVISVIKSLDFKPKVKIQGITGEEPIDPVTGQSIGTPTPNQLPPAL